MKLRQLAEQTNSTLETGSPDLEIARAAGLDIAGPDDITFLANPKYTPQIAETNAAAIFVKSRAGAHETRPSKSSGYRCASINASRPPSEQPKK